MQWLGVLIAAHFLTIVMIKARLGTQHEIWWVSHASLLLTALGLLLNRPRLLAMAFICVCVPHTLWLLDASWAAITGTFPFGIAAYLSDATPLIWLATIHHFYLLPLLIILMWRIRPSSDQPLVAAMAFVLLLLLVSRFGLPVGSNINHTHHAMPRWSGAFIRWTDDLGSLPLVFGVWGWTIIGFLLPGALILRHLHERRSVQTLPPASAAVPVT